MEAVCAEERTKQHTVLANRIEDMLRASHKLPVNDAPPIALKNGNDAVNFIIEKIPEKKLNEIILPKTVVESCQEFVAEHMKVDILRSHGLEPRNKNSDCSNKP